MKFGYGGCCCEKCHLFGIGVGRTFQATGLTEQQKEASLARHTVAPEPPAPAPVVYVPGQPYTFELAPESTWEIRSPAGSPDGWMLHLPLFVPASGWVSAVDVEVIFYPARPDDAHLGDLRCRIQFAPAASPAPSLLTVTLESDWDAPGYAFGAGPVVATRTGAPLSTSLAQLRIAILADSIELPLSGTSPPWGASHGMRPGWLHRPIQHRIPRKVRIINHSSAPYRFRGLGAGNVFDERRLPADAEPPKCPTYTANNRWMQHNEPLAIRSVTTMGEWPDAVPRALGWGNSVNWSDLGLRYSHPSQPFAASPEEFSPDPLSSIYAGPDTIFPAHSPTIEHAVFWEEPEPMASDAAVRPADVQRVVSVVRINIWSQGWNPRYAGFGGIIYWDRRHFTTLAWTLTLEHDVWDRGAMPSFAIHSGIRAGDTLAGGAYQVLDATYNVLHTDGPPDGEQRLLLPIFWRFGPYGGFPIARIPTEGDHELITPTLHLSQHLPE